MAVASISEKKPVRFNLAHGINFSALSGGPLFAATTNIAPADGLRLQLPDPVFNLLTNVHGTDLHNHEGGSADRSFLRYTLIKGILKGGITKLVIKPTTPGGQGELIRLEDEWDDKGRFFESDITKMKRQNKYREIEKNQGVYIWDNDNDEKAFYSKWIKDPVYLDTQLKTIHESKHLGAIAAHAIKVKGFDRKAEVKTSEQRFYEAAETFHFEKAKQLEGQLDRYSYYKSRESWFWTDFLSTESLNLYFRYYEDLNGMLQRSMKTEKVEVGDTENPETAQQLTAQIDKVNAYQQAVFKWSTGNNKGEKELDDLFKEARKNSLTDYRKTSENINPAVKKLHVANINAYNFINRLAKENVRYAEYRVSLTGNDIGDNSNQTYYYDGQDKLWAVAAGLNGAKLNNARWGTTIDYGITVLLERQPKLTSADKVHLEALATDEEKEAYKTIVAVKEADRVVKLALKNKRDAIRENERYKKEGIASYDPRARITSIDLAGDEANYPADAFASVFEQVHKFNREMIAKGTPEHCLGITIHAGEEPSSRNYKWSESIEKSFGVGYRPGENGSSRPVTPFRMGHGIMLWTAESKDGVFRREYAAYCQNPRGWADAIKKDPDRLKAVIEATPLVKNLIDANVGIELCPKSNVQTGSVPYYTVHPALFFLTLGLKASINTDNRTISNTDVSNELIKLHQHLGLRWNEIKQLVTNGAETAFIADDAQRATILADIQKGLNDLENDPKHVLGRLLLDGYRPTTYERDPALQNGYAKIKTQVNGTYPTINTQYYSQTANDLAFKQLKETQRAISQQVAQLSHQPWVANA